MAYLPIFFLTKDERAQRDNFHVWSCHFASEHFAFDDMMTTKDLTGTSNGERSFTKSVHRKSALPFGISNSNWADVIIGLQRSRKAKNSSTLMIQIFKSIMNLLRMYLKFPEFLIPTFSNT